METFLRMLFATVATLVVLKKARKRQTLSTSGCAAAFFVGIVTAASSLCHFAALLAFFYVSNKATKFRQEEKRKYDEEAQKGTQRDALQVFSNGFFSTLFALLYICDCGLGEHAIDFAHNYNASWYTIAVLAALSCSCGDTLASELGTAFNRRSKHAFHVVLWTWVPKGVNGGVSLAGTVASVVGGFLVALAYFVALQAALVVHSILPSTGDQHSHQTTPIPPQWPLLLIGAASGFFGSLVDSLLGGYLQYSGFDKQKNLVVSTPGLHVVYVSGFRLLSNNQVNFVSCGLMAIAAPYVAFKAYKYAY